MQVWYLILASTLLVAASLWRISRWDKNPAEYIEFAESNFLIVGLIASQGQLNR